MEKTVDCLLIGHNDTHFEEYEKIIERMGLDSGAYRDLNLNYLRCDHKPYTASGIFNSFGSEREGFEPITMGRTFSNAIAYLGSYLNRHGLSFDYVNSFQDEKAQLVEKLKHNNILTIAIITTFYIIALPIIEIINFIKKHNQTAKIIVGGPFVSTQLRTLEPASWEFLFKETIQADFFVNSSQGELTLVKIIHALKNNLPWDQIENIHYKMNNKYRVNSVLPENIKLSENPVNWELFSENIGEFVNVRTTISCPFSCAFCGFPQHAGKYQTLEVAGIERELNLLDKIGTVKSINFVDDTFNVPPERFKKMIRMMIKNKYRFNWHSYFRCQYADREMVELMKESGCEGVFLGIESGNPQILKNMNKAINLEKYLECISLLKEYGIVTFGSFITGFPGETEETIRDTIQFIEESQLDFYRTQLWYCEPITPIWKEKQKFNIKGSSFEWSHGTMTSGTACDFIDDMFLTIKKYTWIPQYDFDFHSVFYLIHRGMSLDDVKHFLKIFNKGIEKKLLNPDQRELSNDLLEQLIKIIRGQGFYDPDNHLNEEENILDKYDADFDY